MNRLVPILRATTLYVKNSTMSPIEKYVQFKEFRRKQAEVAAEEERKFTTIKGRDARE